MVLGLSKKHAGFLELCCSDYEKLSGFLELWCWDYQKYAGVLELVREKFSEEIKSKKIEILRSNSIDAAKLFQNNYFDWIYVDTDHSYSTTIQELNAYESKIKSNGFICGHDYVMGNWSRSNN